MFGISHFGLYYLYSSTTNPDVAVFFACNGQIDKDGAVFIYVYWPHRGEWRSTLVMCELARLESNKEITVQDLAERVLENNPNLKDSFEQIEDLNGLIVSFIDHGFMAIPNEENLQGNIRLRRQEGAFFVCGPDIDPKPKASDRFSSRAGRIRFNPRTAFVPDSLRRHSDSLVKIIIPKKNKPELLQQLALKGITEEYLCPDK